MVSGVGKRNGEKREQLVVGVIAMNGWRVFSTCLERFVFFWLCRLGSCIFGEFEELVALRPRRQREHVQCLV